jgi:DNA-directed RNA polymerase specialized sigma24 family protein
LTGNTDRRSTTLVQHPHPVLRRLGRREALTRLDQSSNRVGLAHGSIGERAQAVAVRAGPRLEDSLRARATLERLAPQHRVVLTLRYLAG